MIIATNFCRPIDNDMAVYFSSGANLNIVANDREGADFHSVCDRRGIGNNSAGMNHQARRPGAHIIRAETAFLPSTLATHW